MKYLIIAVTVGHTNDAYSSLTVKSMKYAGKLEANGFDAAKEKALTMLRATNSQLVDKPFPEYGHGYLAWSGELEFAWHYYLIEDTSGDSE